ncbi:MAG: DUF4097 family beta strand repeat-containing protein [Candidatus Zixiibacteriota bacterium]
MLILQAGSSYGKDYQYEYQKIIDVEPGLELTIKGANGNIILTTNNENILKIEAVKKINADSKDEADLVADHVQISVAQVDGHFSIEPQFLKIQDRSPSFWKKILGKSGESSYGSIDFVISVPTDCNADIYSSSGDVETAGIRGKLFISGTAGNITIRDNQGALEITTTSGLVELNDIEGKISINASGSDVNFYSINGDVEIRNSSGQITGEYLVGDLILIQTTGNMDLKHIEGDIRLKSTSGKINISQDFGALDVSTESGNINIKTGLNSIKDYFIETVSGSIEFLVPVASGGEIKIEAESGDIDTRIPISIDSFSKTRITGIFGHGGPKVSLMTKSGEIILSEF